jgi:tetratricopeptide (TPR) repeat protein
LGEFKSDAGEFELALNDLTNALRLNPSDALAYFNRAILYKAMQKYDLIEGDLRNFLLYAPSNHPYRADAERLLTGLEKPLPSKVEMVRQQKQQALLEKIVQLNNDKHHLEAIACCDEFLAVKRSEAMVWDEKAFALWSLGRQPEALEVCREGIATNPQGARLYHTLGLLLSEMQRYREALGALEKYLAIAPPEYAPNFPGVEKEIARLKQILGLYP